MPSTEVAQLIITFLVALGGKELILGVRDWYTGKHDRNVSRARESMRENQELQELLEEAVKTKNIYYEYAAYLRRWIAKNVDTTISNLKPWPKVPGEDE